MGKRNRIRLIATGAALCLLLGASSFAAVVNPGDTVSFAFALNHASGFPGGAFLAYDSTTHSSWYSFCLEYDEYISLGTNYVVDSVIPQSVNGGIAGGDPDPISSKTAYLYSLYATGGLGFTGPGTGVQQQALQDVFWYLEEEIGGLPSPGSVLGDLAAEYLARTDGISEDGNRYGVSVVNPTRGGAPAQSQLVYVPEPAALMLLGTGLLCLFGYKRTRRTA